MEKMETVVSVYWWLVVFPLCLADSDTEVKANTAELKDSIDVYGEDEMEEDEWDDPYGPAMEDIDPARIRTFKGRGSEAAIEHCSVFSGASAFHLKKITLLLLLSYIPFEYSNNTP
nr:uncharacterized protein LOC106690545 [Halyomorpha halys]